MTHRRWHYIDETERRQWQNPEEILNAVGLRPGFIFVDIGCGNGFFAIPAARLVGHGGRVYGLDISSEAIDEIRRKAAAEGLDNVELTIGKAEEATLCHSCADVVFFGNVLHDFQDPAKALANARGMVKPAGKLVDLDWRKTGSPFGPPVSVRFDEATAVGLIESAGFKAETVSRSGAYHYLIIARPVRIP